MLFKNNKLNEDNPVNETNGFVEGLIYALCLILVFLYYIFIKAIDKMLIVIGIIVLIISFSFYSSFSEAIMYGWMSFSILLIFVGLVFWEVKDIQRVKRRNHGN
jgi:FtsH-binding integral membrane protein